MIDRKVNLGKNDIRHRRICHVYIWYQCGRLFRDFAPFITRFCGAIRVSKLNESVSDTQMWDYIVRNRRHLHPSPFVNNLLTVLIHLYALQNSCFVVLIRVAMTVLASFTSKRQEPCRWLENEKKIFFLNSVQPTLRGVLNDSDSDSEYSYF